MAEKRVSLLTQPKKAIEKLFKYKHNILVKMDTTHTQEIYCDAIVATDVIQCTDVRYYAK